jgi:hypothetical protein
MAQTLLRHASLQTTGIYVQVADGKRVEAIDRLESPVAVGALVAKWASPIAKARRHDPPGPRHVKRG